MKNFKPMLARVYADQSQIDWSDYVYMQPKLDGVRCIFTKDGAFSRTGKKFMNVKHIEKDLKHLFDVVESNLIFLHELKKMNIVVIVNPNREYDTELK